MADNHLWFSIFAYHLPAASRFTRMQRCTCCFVLFFMSLMMSALYFDIKQDLAASELDQYGFAFGPFRVSQEGVIFIILIFRFF